VNRLPEFCCCQGRNFLLKSGRCKNSTCGAHRDHVEFFGAEWCIFSHIRKRKLCHACLKSGGTVPLQKVRGARTPRAPPTFYAHGCCVCQIPRKTRQSKRVRRRQNPVRSIDHWDGVEVTKSSQQARYNIATTTTTTTTERLHKQQQPAHFTTTSQRY